VREASAQLHLAIYQVEVRLPAVIFDQRAVSCWPFSMADMNQSQCDRLTGLATQVMWDFCGAIRPLRAALCGAIFESRR